MGLLRLPGALATSVRHAVQDVRRWKVWSVKEPLRAYLVAAPVVVGLAVALTAANTHWDGRQALIFLALVGCGGTAIEATRKVKEPQGAAVRDLQSIWYLAIAIVLVPVYAFAAPMLLTLYKVIRTRPIVLYRRIFSNATISLAYGCASLVFHAIPDSVAGVHPGTQNHALTWTASVVACAVLGWIINHGLLVVAMKLDDPEARVREIVGSRESITSDLIELSLAVSLALVVAINPVLMALALPSVLLYRRYVLTAQLVGQARIDAKTGLLNAGTWRQEADVEVTRALRTRASLVLVIVHVDHLESVQDTAGGPGAGEVARAMAGPLTDNLRGYDLIGRFGGEEFAVLLPHTDTSEARRITERLRDNIAGQPIAIEDGARSGFIFRLTVSIGIAGLDQSRRGLADLIGAAGTAVTEAKTLGRNRVCVTPGGAG